MAFEPGHSVFRCWNRGPWMYIGAFDHENRQAERAGCLDLGYRGRSAGVLGENSPNAMLAEQADIAFGSEGAARLQDDGIRQARRRFRHVDQTDNVSMLRGGKQLGKSKPAHAAKYGAGLLSYCGDGGSNIRDLDPVVFWLFFPSGPLDRKKCNICCGSRLDSIAAHLAGKRVGRVNEDADVLFAQIVHESRNAAKPANSHRYRLRKGRSSPASKRQDGIETRVRGEQSRKRARFRRTSQDENAHGPL